MLPESVAVRQRAAYDFASCYNNLCSLQSTVPLQYVKVHLKKGVLDINGDKVRLFDWAPILDSIKVNKSLSLIAIRSYFQPYNNTTAKKLHYFKRKVPAIRSKDVTFWIANSIEACISSSNAIRGLDLQGVPLRERDVHIISKGIERNSSLNKISFNYCQISDKGAKLICKALRNHPTITHVFMTGCNITSEGAEEISNLMKHQSTIRHSEAWAESLRYRKPNFNCMSGIRRITLNGNPMIGDEGSNCFAEALKDDLWVKALDLQHCGISSVGALKLLETIQHNNTIVVLDVRRNPMIDSATLRSLLGRVLMNANEKDETDYPWVKEETPKDPYKTRRYRPPRQNNKSFGKTSGEKGAKRYLSYESVREKPPSPGKSFMPWRTAARAKQHKLGFVEEIPVEEETIIHFRRDKTVHTIESLSDSESENVLDHTKMDETHLTLKESQNYIKQLKVDLIDSRRRLSAARENEKRLHDRVMALEVENARLHKQNIESFENSRLKSQIEDDMLLDSIEQSFNKFHDFLNMLNEVGLGSLASAAGLDGQFSLPFEQKTDTVQKEDLLERKSESDERSVAEKAIIIHGATSTPEKPKKQKDIKKSKEDLIKNSENAQQSQENDVKIPPGTVSPQLDMKSSSDSEEF